MVCLSRPGEDGHMEEETNSVVPAERTKHRCVGFARWWHTNADTLQVCASSKSRAQESLTPYKPTCKYKVCCCVLFDRCGMETYCWKARVLSHFVLEEEDKSVDGVKQFSACQRTERWADRWEDEGEGGSVSRRVWGRCKERLLWEVIYKNKPCQK